MNIFNTMSSAWRNSFRSKASDPHVHLRADRLRLRHIGNFRAYGSKDVLRRALPISFPGSR